MYKTYVEGLHFSHIDKDLKVETGPGDGTRAPSTTGSGKLDIYGSLVGTSHREPPSDDDDYYGTTYRYIKATRSSFARGASQRNQAIVKRSHDL